MSEVTPEDRARVRVFLCECGPILREGLDLDTLQERVAGLPRVAAVGRHRLLCSEEGKAWLADEVAAHPGERVVVAACTPREHGAEFMQVCGRAGLNPYLVAFANVREQCAWVTEDRAAATEKALRFTHAAVARVLRQVPLEDREIDCNPDVLVVGAGVAGLTAARQFAAAGRRVTLVERSPAIGGRVALLGETYPDIECASCMLEPVMDETLHHPLIETLTCSEVEGVKGSVGNFIVTVRKTARHVDPEACYACRTCQEACPVEVPNEADLGLATRRAIYIAYTGALPNASLIDEASCLHYRDDGCSACAEACPFGSIDLDAQDEVVERNVGAIVLATGSRAILADDAEVPPGVVTAMALERLLNSAGPTSGEMRMPGAEAPRTVALVYCAAPDGSAPVVPCSKICCMTMAKYRHLLAEKAPDVRVHEFVWERCTGGRGYREFAREVDEWAPAERIRMDDGDRVVGYERHDGGVSVRYTRGGDERTLDVDLVVVVPPVSGDAGNEALAALLRIGVDDDGFVVAEHRHLRPFRTLVEGVLIAGAAHGPKEIQEAVAHAAAAAGEALSLLVPGRKLVLEPTVAVVDEERCGGCWVCVGMCPYQAIVFDDERHVSAVEAVLCHGCGACVAACPSGAIEARHLTDEQLFAEIEALLSE